jgi:hypothetical protein
LEESRNLEIFLEINEDWWIALRILLSPRNLGPTPWIGILKDTDLEERESMRILGRHALDFLDDILVAWPSSNNLIVT